jgi:hypothetical protein
MTDPDPRTADDDSEDALSPQPEQAEGDDDVAPPQPGSPRG